MSKALRVIGLVLLVCFVAAPAHGETVYFFVGEIQPGHNDGYVLPLSNPSDIAHARDLIEYGPGIGGAIVAATIQRLPPCSVNRNYVAEGLPCWSWEVSFLSFTDITPEIYDGWPGWVEEAPQVWPSGSTIGFWDYTVVAELGTDLESWNCDLSADGKINFNDFGIFAQYWQQSALGGPDIDGSGMVDIYDLAIFADNWLSCFHIPAYATNPNPANNAVNIGIQLTLSWTPSRDATSHDVYLGTNVAEINSADTADANVYMGSVDTAQWDINNYDVNGLEYSMTYFWRVDEITPCGTVKGDTWSFTTGPAQARNPSPANLATYVDVNTDLSWTAGSGATSHDVYFGTTNPPPFQGNQTGTTYDPGTMDTYTTYYWRIDEKNGSGITTGILWNFTTGSEDEDENLVDWWKFDEGTGTTAYDSAGTNNGHIMGAATWTTGKIGDALSYDGNDDYILCFTAPTNCDNITVSAWMQTSTNGALVSNRDSTQGYGTWFTLFSSVIEIGDNSQGGYEWLTFKTPTLDGLWHLVVYAKDGINHAIYVDGSLDQSFTSNAVICRTYRPSLYIGKRWNFNTSAFWFNGIIDEVRIYNKALSAEEVLQLYQNGL